MFFQKAYIPHGGYWSTPFSRWQGSFAHLNAIPFAAEIAVRALREREIEPGVFDGVHLGLTVPQKHSFYGGPWLAGLIGAETAPGPIISQACATGARVVSGAAAEVELGEDRAILTITADRCSNGPHIYYPDPLGPGGKGDAEDWVWDNFGHDPFARNAMIETAENVAREAGITREEQDELTLLRYRQYGDALAHDSAFLRRFAIMPLEVKDARGRKVLATVDGDEGVFPTTAGGLAKLRPVVQGGTVTFGTQTHPADGNCGIVVTTRERAREMARQMARDPKIEIQLLSYGEARVKKGYMAMSPVPAARQALSRAGISIQDLGAIKTHNPFAVNDIYFCREMGVKPEAMNNYGSSLVWGHPQGPTGQRLIVELIEELVLAGGGYGLFVGCAAGDTGAGVVLKVGA